MSRLLYTQVPEPGHLAPTRGWRTLQQRWVSVMGPRTSRLEAPDQGRGSNVPATPDHRAGKVQARNAGLGPAGQGRAGGAPAVGARRRSLPRSRRGSLCKSGRTCPSRGLRSSGPPLHFLLLPAPRSPLAQPRAAASATAAVTLAAHPHPSCKPSRAEPSRALPRQLPSACEPGPAPKGWGQQNPRPWPGGEQRRGVQDTDRRVPARLSRKSQWDSGKGAKLCRAWSGATGGQ